MKRYTLMIPGPMEADEDTLHALGQQIPPHYEEAFARSFREIVTMLNQVFKTKNDVLVLSGSGTVGVCAALATLMQESEKALIIDNGELADYFETICSSLGILSARVSAPRGQRVHPDAIREALKKDAYDAVCVCHNESSTGMVNPLEEIARVAHEFGIPLVTDSISGIGGTELKTDEWGVDVVCGASQKALCCPPGIALVAVSDFAWEIMEKKNNRPIPFYLDLIRWRDSARDRADWHPTLTTASTTLLAGLEASLKNILKEGVDNRIARFARAARMLTRGMANLGFGTVADPNYASPMVTAFTCPEGFDCYKVRQFLMDEYNIMIGRGAVEGEIRIAHFGRAADRDRITLTALAIEDFMIRERMNVKRGQCLKGIEY